MTEPQTIYGLIVVLGGLTLSHIGSWIREGRKHKTWKANQKTNGKDLTVIKKSVGEIAKDMNTTKLHLEQIKTKVSGQAKTCEQTVKRFDSALQSANDKILDLAMKKENN